MHLPVSRPESRVYHCNSGDEGMGSPMRDANAGADLRWAKAAKRAEGLTDLGIEIVVRRYFRVNLPLTVLVSLGVGFALASVWPDILGDFFPTGIYIGLMLSGLAIFVLGLVYGSKKVSPMVQPQRIGVTIGLSSEEVKHVRRQILAKEPTDAAKLAVLRGAAIQIREGLAKQLLIAPGLFFYSITRKPSTVSDSRSLAAEPATRSGYVCAPPQRLTTPAAVGILADL